MWWWYDRRTPSSELGPAAGPMPGSLAMPTYLPPERRFFVPEVLDAQPVVGPAGNETPVGQTPTAQGPSAASGGRLPGGIPAGVVSIGINVAARALGLPGIIASVINLIVGPAIRRAGTASNPTESSGFANLDQARGPVGESGPEPPSVGGASLADVVRSREGGSDEDATGLAMPGPTTTAVGEDQALLPSLDVEQLDVYGDGGGFVVDTPIDD